MIKTYYQCIFRQKSPLSLTNGEGEEADLDVLLDARGLPFIPGSSLAGLLREMAENENESQAEELFGYVHEASQGSTAEARESKLIISDAVLPEEATEDMVHISVRDSVSISEDGTAADEGKFDFQIVETQQPYTAIIELTHEKIGDSDDKLLEKLMENIAAYGLSSGHKTTRGYGKLSASIRRLCFDLGNGALAESETGISPETKEIIRQWLAFQPMDQGAFEKKEAESICGDASQRYANRTIYSIKLKLEGSFLVQVASSDVGGADAAPLMAKAWGEEKKKPVIPGTSWAGVFRHHMRELCEQYPDVKVNPKDVDAFFGRGADGKPIAKSGITFSESNVIGGKPLTVTRVALDRFTMLPRDAALFTTTVWQGGETELMITLPAATSEGLKNLLKLTLLDLHCGLVTFGHSASIGYGHASIKELRIDGAETEELLGFSLKGSEQ